MLQIEESASRKYEIYPLDDESEQIALSLLDIEKRQSQKSIAQN
jgi:hypothetical protein